MSSRTAGGPQDQAKDFEGFKAGRLVFGVFDGFWLFFSGNKGD
jgi:hypothetical protein